MKARLFAEENRKWWTLAAVVVRPLHDHARQHRRERGAAVDRALAAPEGLGARVGRRRLRAHLRRVHAHRRQARRPARAAARCSSSGSSIFTGASLACGLAGERRRPDRRARRPGARRRADEPRDALDHHRHLPAAPARDGDRHLGRRLGARARDRPARRRRDHRAHQLELDLLHQRPDRRRSAIAAAFAFIDESRDTSREQRPDIPGLVTSALGLFALTYALIEANSYGWGSARIIGAFAVAAVSLVAFVAARAAPAAADARPVALPQPHLQRREHA